MAALATRAAHPKQEKPPSTPRHHTTFHWRNPSAPAPAATVSWRAQSPATMRGWRLRCRRCRRGGREAGAANQEDDADQSHGHAGEFEPTGALTEQQAPGTHQHGDHGDEGGNEAGANVLFGAGRHPHATAPSISVPITSAWSHCPRLGNGHAPLSWPPAKATSP